MNIKNLGIPMPFGVTFGYDTNMYLNSMPDITTVKYYKSSSSMDTLSDLECYDTSTLKIGESFIVKKDEDIHNAEYFWTGKEWIKIGNPNCVSYLNIYSITLNDVKDSISNEEFYMRAYFNSIQSNIRIKQFLNSDFAIYNDNIVTFCGLKGLYNMNLNDTLNNLIYININSAMNILMRKLSKKYNVSYTQPKDLSASIIKSLYDIINQSNILFYQLSKEISNIDISIYTNFISACFSSFKYILESKYENVSSIVLSNDVELQLIDQTLYDRIENNKDIKLFAQEFLQIVYDNTYENNSKFFSELNNVINDFDKKNSHIIRIKKNRIQLYKDLCEGIAGIVNLALLFSIISNCSYGSRNSIYFHFIVPENYNNYN